MLDKILLGKIFISYSAKDKRFVRNLARRLWREGYSVWLDEKELVPGDSISQRLAEALESARVVLVVVTPHSIESEWVKFELSKATDRMVAAGCRIVPVLKGDVSPPAALKGLVYADFRGSFKTGVGRVLAALGRESSKLVSEHTSTTTYEGLLREVFDGSGMGWIDGDYKSLDFEFVEIDGLQEEDRPAEVLYEIVHDYLHKREPLEDRWWSEYKEWTARYSNRYRLVVTERPWKFPVDIVGAAGSGVAMKLDRWSDKYPPSMVVAFVDLGDAFDREERLSRLREAKSLILQVGMELGDKTAQTPSN